MAREVDHMEMQQLLSEAIYNLFVYDINHSILVCNRAPKEY